MLKKEFFVIRQSGNQADRQSGRQAIRQNGYSVSWLKYLICFLFLITHPVKTIAMNQDSTIREPCSGDCGHQPLLKALIDNVHDVRQGTVPQGWAAASEEECPENVKSIRQVMALTYGTCEALEPLDWFTLPGRNNGYLIEYNGTFLQGYKSIKGCAYSTGMDGSCNYISNYNDLKESHPYNRMKKADACEAQMQCGGQPCLTTFTLAAESYAYLRTQRESGDINIFKESTMSDPHVSQQATPKFLGWNCSEYVTTAMALAGQRLVSRRNCEGIPDLDIGDGRQQYNATMYANLAKSNRACTCLDKVDITNDTIQSGDLITINNNDHIMIVESVEQPFFREPTKKEDCDEKNIRFDQLQIRVNHSSYTTSGPASLQLNEYLSLNHGQSITHGMRKYIDECINEKGADADTASEDNNYHNCWTEEDQNEFSDYIFYSKKIGLGNVSNDSKWKVDGEYIIDPMWPKMRDYLSSLCKARWNRANPADTISGVEPDDGFLKVIRHKGTEECTTPEAQRPKLKHKECLGDCINQEENQCPTYGVE